MAKNSPALSSFNAGELSPDVAGRVDNQKYAIGGSTLSNFIPRVQGGARRRPGTRFVQPVKNSASRTWLRKFVFSQGQAYQVEFGAGYCRFYTNHGQVQVSGVSAWNNATQYAVGNLVVQGGINYYAIAASLNQAPPNASYWYPLTGTIYEIPSPYTAGMLTNSDGTCGLQIQQSGDVLYIACGGYWPMTLTRFGPTQWVLTPYAPPDGPFLDQNTGSSPALYVTPIAGMPGFVDCFATSPVFAASDAATASTPGRLVRIGVQYFNIPTWAQNLTNTQDGTNTAGDLRRYNGNTYMALNTGNSGPNPPVQTSGVQLDGKGGIEWLYQDSGYGIGQVTQFFSSLHVRLQVSPYAGQPGAIGSQQFYNFPKATQGVLGTITGISQANPAVVTCANSFSVGDPVYLTNVGGMTQISEQMYVVSAANGTTFTLAGVDSTGFSPYTSGGTAIKNASLNWQLGAWGIGLFGFTGSFPTCNAFYADRLFWFGGISWWGSVNGLYSSHAEDQYGVVTAASAVSGIIAADDVDAITWASPLLILLIGTRGGEFGLAPITPSTPVGPGNIQVTRFSKFKSRAVTPQIIGISNFYVQSSGKKVYAQDFNFWLQIYESSNQMRLANHIAGYTVSLGLIDAAYHQEPYEALWAVRSDGLLICYVFDKQDNVTAWQEEPVGGSAAGAAVVECVSVTPAPDGTRDEAWMIVNRTINGQVVRSVEYIEKDLETGDTQSSMCYLDASGQYNGAPTTTISVPWLVGETVGVCRDGGGHPDCVVSAGGTITLQVPGSVVQVGLKCPANLITMDLEGGADVGTGQGKLKRASHAVVRVKNSLGGYIGMAGGPLTLMQPNVSTTNLGSPPPLLTGDTDLITLQSDHSRSCKIQIQQHDPFPMEILALFPTITVQETSPP